MKKFLFLGVILLLVAGCSKHTPKVVTLKSGLKYEDDTVGTGKTVKMGDLLTVDFEGWYIKDSTNLFQDWSKDTARAKNSIGSTKKRHKTFQYKLEKGSFVKGSAEGIVGMKVGGTRTIIIPSNLAYGKKGIGPIPPNSSLKLVVEVHQAKEITPVKQWKIDSSRIKTAKGGLKYEIVKGGNGPKPKSGDLVTVNYSGFLLNGKKFDSSVERDKPFSFIIGQHQVIPGWDEGIALLNEGSKAILIIPPSMAYGSRKVGPIPANSTLIFDVELLKVKSHP